METTSTISTEELLPRLEPPDAVLLLDVREPDEFAEWRIPGAVNIPLGELTDRVGDIPHDREVVTVCAAGTRAARAVERLAEAGIEAVVLAGGMGAWAAAYDCASIEVGGATVVQVRRRGKGCLSYVIGAGDAAAVIDPSADISRYLSIADEHGWTITHIFDTHLHADHVSGARALAEATGVDLVLNSGDPFQFAYAPLADGIGIPLSDDVTLTISAIHTPGHTMGSTSYLLGEAAIFSGDTLFLESVGRPDLYEKAEEFAHALYHTLHERVLQLPDSALVLPSHYGDGVEIHADKVLGAPLGSLRERLRMLSVGEDEFVSWAASAVPARPPNYAAIVKANQGNSTLAPEELRALEVGPNRCAVRA